MSIAPMSSMTGKHRDFLKLTAYVLAQHGYYKRAETLLSALCLSGTRDAAVYQSLAILSYCLKDWTKALSHLDELDAIDPVERFGVQSLTERQKMRRYIRACCYRELGQETKMQEAVNIFLRRRQRSAPEEAVAPTLS